MSFWIAGILGTSPRTGKPSNDGRGGNGACERLRLCMGEALSLMSSPRKRGSIQAVESALDSRFRGNDKEGEDDEAAACYSTSSTSQIFMSDW